MESQEIEEILQLALLVINEELRRSQKQTTVTCASQYPSVSVNQLESETH